jgi:hypothetical protein
MLELHLVAFHAYRSDDKSHLTFPSGACIIARPGQEGNALWFGSYEQRRGWFPPSYCRIVLVPPRRPRAAYDDRRRSTMKNDRTPPSPAGMEVTTRSRSLLDQKSGRPSSNRGYWQERPDSIDSSWRSRSLDNDESDHAENASHSNNEPPHDDDNNDPRVLPPVSGTSSIGTPKARSGQSIFAKVDRFVEELLIRSDHLPLLPENADESETRTTSAPAAKLRHRFQDNVERNVPITAFSGDVVDSSSIIRNSPQQQQQSSDIRGNDSRRTRNDNIKSKVTADHHRPSTLTCPNHTMTKNQSTTTTSSPWTTTTTPSPSKVWNKGHRRATSEIIVTNALQQYRDNIHPPVFIVQKTEMEEAENEDPIDPIEVLAAEFRRRQLRARLRRVQPISAS